MKLQILNQIFIEYVNEISDHEEFLKKFPKDCLSTYAEAVFYLQDNIIHHAARCFLLRDDNSQTRLPIRRMPFGLLDYIVRFFSLRKTNNLRCEKDYEECQVSIYANFCVQWVSMRGGPAWECDVFGESQEQMSVPAVTNDDSSLEMMPDCDCDCSISESNGADLLAKA